MTVSAGRRAGSDGASSSRGSRFREVLPYRQADATMIPHARASTSRLERASAFRLGAGHRLALPCSESATPQHNPCSHESHAQQGADDSRNDYARDDRSAGDILGINGWLALKLRPAAGIGGAAGRRRERGAELR